MLKKQLEDQLERMKEIAGEMSRYKQTLDEVIWIMEKEVKEASDEEYLKNFVVAETNYYRDLKKDTFHQRGSPKGLFLLFFFGKGSILG